MQSPPASPARPSDPASRSDAGAPAVLDKTAIPELGIKGRSDVSADPGLMPGLRTAPALPPGARVYAAGAVSFAMIPADLEAPIVDARRDQLLQDIAHRLAGVARHGDTVARLSGDEFVMVLLDVETQESLDATIGRILQSPLYIGSSSYNKRKTANGQIVPRPKEEWLIVPGVVPPIIDRETWEQAQTLFESRRGIGPAARTSEHLLSGLLRCAVCGGGMIARCSRKEGPRAGTWTRQPKRGPRRKRPCKRSTAGRPSVRS